MKKDDDGDDNKDDQSTTALSKLMPLIPSIFSSTAVKDRLAPYPMPPPPGASQERNANDDHEHDDDIDMTDKEWLGVISMFGINLDG